MLLDSTFFSLQHPQTRSPKSRTLSSSISSLLSHFELRVLPVNYSHSDTVEVDMAGFSRLDNDEATLK